MELELVALLLDWLDWLEEEPELLPPLELLLLAEVDEDELVVTGGLLGLLLVPDSESPSL